ncbi:MAG: type II toxin-antitoxin system VapC family toxin [bacterium]
MLFLDTHVMVWLYQKCLELLSRKARTAIEKNEIFISPIIILELEYLYEINKIKDNSHTILDYLQNKIGLTVDNENFLEIVNVALNETWTRDPFNRLIVAHSKYRDAVLITKDKEIIKNYYKAIF